jgi:myosin protein heavy chain
MYSRDAIKGRVDALEQETRQAKEQLTEMTRTATDYSNMIKKKEETIDRLHAELSSSKAERDQLTKQIIQLRGQAETLAAELDAQKEDRTRDDSARRKLQDELDDLRTVLRAKTTEDTKRSEVQKSMEAELSNLRREVAKLEGDLGDARSQALEGQNKLKVQLDSAVREHTSLQQSHRALVERERDVSVKLKKAESSLADVEKTRRSLESEVQSLRSRHIDLDGQISELQRAKDVRILLFMLPTKLTLLGCAHRCWRSR